MGEVTWFRVRRTTNGKTEHYKHRNHTIRAEQPLLLENLVRPARFCAETAPHALRCRSFEFLLDLLNLY